MGAILSGTVREVGKGFILIGNARIGVSSHVRPEGLSQGNRVRVRVRRRGANWIAEDIQLMGPNE
jgi:hypothetical protein